MAKSHAAGWASDAPTPAQIKELFAQIESGRITKQRLQRVLRGNSEVRISVLPYRKGMKLGLYDNSHLQQKSVVVTRVVDITDLCPKAESLALLLFARTVNGYIVQLRDAGENAEDRGGTHFHYQGLRNDQLAADDIFKHIAVDWWGISPKQLAQVIFEYAPPDLRAFQPGIDG
ncbi:hypothetical protein HY491_04640 [Candidatus Woesearchaeota archaeon]|nr:hypothetical protein [Candidatus Woesearchaeota archaeon]